MAICLFGLAGAMFILNNDKVNLTIENGYHSVTAEQLGNQSLLSLTGEWSFYPNQFLTTEAIWKEKEVTTLVNLPHSWRDEDVTYFKQSDRYGYGTYHLQLEIPEQLVGQSFGLYLERIGSAYRLFVNGIEQEGVGVVSQSAQHEQASLTRNAVFIQPQDEKIDLVVHVSSHSFREGGIYQNIYFGLEQFVLNSYLKDLALEAVLIGALLAISLYHFIVLRIRGNDLSNLYISLVGVLGAIRTWVYNEEFVFLLFPEIDWQVMMKIEYITPLLIFIALILYLKKNYQAEVNGTVANLSIMLIVVVSTFILFTPTRVFTNLINIHVLIMVLLLGYYIFYVGIIATFRKRPGSVIYLIGLMIGVVGIINDTLFVTNVIDTVNLFSYSIFSFLIFRAMISSYRYGLTFERNEQLNSELIQLTANLEDKVVERTSELLMMNKELNSLQRQRGELLTNIAHDLGAPLFGIQTHLHLMKKTDLSQDASERLQALDEKLLYMKRLINDLFDLSKLELKHLSFYYERVPAEGWVQNNNRKCQQSILDQGMEWEYKKELDLEDYTLFIDQTRIEQVIENYLQNAVKFSRGKGYLLKISYELESSQSNQFLKVSIRDFGVGISGDDQVHVFERFFSNREGVTEGTGLGLAISKAIIEQHGGTVGVVSQLGEGSTFYFTLPLELN